MLLDSISIAGQVETLYQTLLRTETCFSVRSQSPSRCKPNFKFYLRIETGSQLDLHHRTDGNLTSSYSKNRNKLPSFILVTRHIVNASNYS